MKNKWLIFVVGVLLLCTVVVLWFFGGEYDKINPLMVERIVLSGNKELGLIDAARFIKLYNSAEYAGEGDWEAGTTPEYSVVVKFRDGTCLIVYDFEMKGRDLEVELRDQNGKQKAWFYLNSKELEKNILEFLEEY